MCFGSDDSARWQANLDKEQAKQDEADRQLRVKQAQSGETGSVDAAFKQFTPQYYEKFQTDQIAANRPQVDEQYSRAVDKATAALAGRGVGRSSIANNAFADLSKTKGLALGQIANDAVTAAKQLQAAMEKQKTDLYTMAMSASDPAAVSNRAYGEATALQAHPTSSPLGDLFGATLAPIVNYVRADTYSPHGGKIASFFNAPPTAGRGSGMVVG